MNPLIPHALEKADHVLVITHVDPDGDAVGSLTAVGQALKQMGLHVTLACDDRVPERFSYLSMSGDVRQKPNEHVAYDILIAVDCADQQRMGYAFADLPHPRPFIINIDHHITNTRFGDIDVIEPGATSTAEILYGLFGEMSVTLTEGIATSLLTGLVTDTLGFRTVGVTPVTLRAAADLIDAGANLGFVSMQALNLRAYATMQIWRAGMNKMQFEDGLVWTTITNQERQEAGFRSGSSVGLTNLLADIEEASMAAVLMEVEDGSIKVSLRCRPPYDVSVVATELGGGGHALAAGCTLSGPLDEAEALLVNACKEAIANQEAAAAEAVAASSLSLKGMPAG